MLPEQPNRFAMDLQRLASRLLCPLVGRGGRVDVCPPGHLIDRRPQLLILQRSSDDLQAIGEAANRRYCWVVAGERSISVDTLIGLIAGGSNASHGLAELQEQITDLD